MSVRRVLIALVLPTAAVACAPTGPAPQPVSVGSVEWLSPGIDCSEVRAISDSGVAVGTMNPGCQGGSSRAVAWHPGIDEEAALVGYKSEGVSISRDGRFIVVTDLSGDPADLFRQVSVVIGPSATRRFSSTVVTDVNDHGISVGVDETTSQPVVIDAAGVPSVLPMPPGYESAGGLAISNTGWVSARLDGGGLPTLAGRWRLGEPGVETVRGWAHDVNDAGIVAGDSGHPVARFGGFRWYPDGSLSTLLNVPGDILVAGFAINQFGDVAGASWPSRGAHPVIWPAGSVEPIELVPGACQLTAYAALDNWVAGWGDPAGTDGSDCVPPYTNRAWRVRIR